MIGGAAAAPLSILFTVDEVEIHGPCVIAASDAAHKVTAGDRIYWFVLVVDLRFCAAVIRVFRAFRRANPALT